MPNHINVSDKSGGIGNIDFKVTIPGCIIGGQHIRYVTTHGGNPGRCLASLRSRPKHRIMMGSEGEASQSFSRTVGIATFKPRTELPAHPSLHGTFVSADARIRVRGLRRTAPASDIPYCRSTSDEGSLPDVDPRQHGPWQDHGAWPGPYPRPSTVSF